MSPASKKRPRSGNLELERDDEAKTKDQGTIAPHKVYSTMLSDNLWSAATSDEKKSWRGYCEIESDPAFFQVILEDFGVKGIKVQEVLGLDTEFLSFLPKPVYGLIFLFRWRDEDDLKPEDESVSDIWFAKQTVPNACASVALLNIVNNVPELELGTQLSQFKEDTKHLTPSMRGDAIGDFEFIRAIHNSFARKNDMLNEDLKVKNEVDILSKKRTQKKRKKDDDEIAAFHFNAFVSHDKQLWKLDGLAQSPVKIGDLITDDWLEMARPDITDHMSRYGEQEMGFALLALCKDPLSETVRELAENVQVINILLQNIQQNSQTNGDSDHGPPDQALFHDNSVILGPHASYCLSADDITAAETPSKVQNILDKGDQDLLSSTLHEHVTRQSSLRSSISNFLEQKASDRAKVQARQWDHAPLIMHWVQKLAQKGLIQELVEEHSAKDESQLSS